MSKLVGYLLDDKSKKEVDIAETGYFNGIGKGLVERPICNICGNKILKGEIFIIYYENTKKKIRHNQE